MGLYTGGMAKRDVDRFSELLQALYGGLVEEVPWERFLRAFAEWLDATYATLILTAPGTDTPGTILTPGADPQTADDYAESFFASDPFRGLPEGKVTAFSEFLGGETARDSDFYRDFLDAAGGDQILGVDLHCETGFEARLRATRDRTRSDFGLAEREAFQRIVPHLRHALRLHERLQTSRAEHGVFHGAVEQMGLGAIILDRRGKVLRTNAVADRFLAAGDGIALSRGSLRLEDPAVARELEALLRNATADMPARRFRIQRPSGARELSIMARPIAAPNFMSSGAALALFVSDPSHDAALNDETVRDLFQLTRMEASLSIAIANGRSLVDAADSLGIAHNTARSHLRSIFAKTGARRQSQLVHLIRSSIR